MLITQWKSNYITNYSRAEVICDIVTYFWYSDQLQQMPCQDAYMPTTQKPQLPHILYLTLVETEDKTAWFNKQQGYSLKGFTGYQQLV